MTDLRDLPDAVGGPPVVGAQILADLRHLGLSAGATVLVSASLRSLGHVVGGSQTLVEVLLDAVGPDGTLLSYVGWEDNPYHLDDWPAEWREAYLAGCPPFDPDLSEARRAYGRLPERLRTWPGARRSSHPEASFVALGARAAELVAQQDWSAPYGTDSPLGRLVAADGQVLLLGSPLNTATLVHHIETVSPTPGKRYRSYRMPVRDGDDVRWQDFTDIDTSDGAYPYGEERWSDQVAVLEGIIRSSGAAVFGRVAQADSVLVSARAFVTVGLQWIADVFGQPEQ